MYLYKRSPASNLFSGVPRRAPGRPVRHVGAPAPLSSARRPQGPATKFRVPISRTGRGELSSQGYRPKPGERSMTKQEWKWTHKPREVSSSNTAPIFPARLRNTAAFRKEKDFYRYVGNNPAIFRQRYHYDQFADKLIPISARSHPKPDQLTQRGSIQRGPRADYAESLAYQLALKRGEIGIQRPVNVHGSGPDFITVLRQQDGSVREIILSDVEKSESGQFRKQLGPIRPEWIKELDAAIERVNPRKNKELYSLRKAIDKARAQNRYRLRILRVDLSAKPVPRVTGW